MVSFNKLVRMTGVTWAAWIAYLGLIACSETPDRVVVTRKRVASVVPRPGIPGATSEQRFGSSRPAPAGSKTTGAAPIEWDDPADWAPVAATQFRTANFKVGQETECYVTLLPGAAGGVLENVNRWRGQMGLGPTTDAEIGALAQLSLLGGPAPFVILEGNFSGMNGASGTGWLMYGTVFRARGGTLFVKMVGPAEEVRAEREKFVAFCGSIRRPGGPPQTQNAGSQSSQGTARPSQFAWTAPGGWMEEPKRSMREVSYSIGDAGEAECYISILGGGAGGVEANVNRWRDQVGLEPLSPKAISELPQVDVLGGKATLFEAAGEFTGMGDATAASGQAILGIIRELDSNVLFVKMVGPAELVNTERDNFISFCTSLREEG